SIAQRGRGWGRGPTATVQLTLQTIAIVGLSILAAIAVLMATRRLLPQTLIKESHAVAATTMQILGTSYAVLLAFVVVVAWQSFQDAQSRSIEEAADLTTLYHLTAALPQPEQQQARDVIVEYARIVTEEEWPAMAQGHAVPEARAQIARLWQIYTGLAATAQTNPAYADSLQNVADLENQRELRLLDARSDLPLFVWVLLIVGAVLTVGCVYFLGVTSSALEVTMTASLAGMIALILVLIYALDHPFQGDLSVSPDDYHAILQEVTRGG
ncbi:MAG: DUF4239 domain-containing protein, partial [Dehalococcoidia bacterium]